MNSDRRNKRDDDHRDETAIEHCLCAGERAHRVWIIARRSYSRTNRKYHRMRDAGGAKSRDEIAARRGIAEPRYLAARSFADCLGRVVALASFPEGAHLVEL